jgi:hypothetical protein
MMVTFKLSKNGAPLNCERAVESAKQESPDQPSVGGVPDV